MFNWFFPEKNVLGIKIRSEYQKVISKIEEVMDDLENLRVKQENYIKPSSIEVSCHHIALTLEEISRLLHSQEKHLKQFKKELQEVRRHLKKDKLEFDSGKIDADTLLKKKFGRILHLSDATTETEFFSRLLAYDEEIDHTIFDKLYYDVVELPKHNYKHDKISEYTKILSGYIAKLKRTEGELEEHLEEYRLLKKMNTLYNKGWRGKALLTEVFGIQGKKDNQKCKATGLRQEI
ncbi:MAG: hypothetical protein ACLFP2_00370 [Candidatus Woesearchaeota archaeon]